jgi:hypothetical protein
MARITYDDRTAAAYKEVREVPRDGLAEWREAVRRHLDLRPGMTVADIGAGTGQFTAAFSDWFDLGILAVEPSAAMRARIPRRPNIARGDDPRRSRLPEPHHGLAGRPSARPRGPGVREDGAGPVGLVGRRAPVGARGRPLPGMTAAVVGEA